jgi:Tfp pilus assembly PilM family ATPase
MTVFNRLTAPRLPRCAFVVDETELAAVELKRRGARFSLAAAARTPLEPGMLVPDFEKPNLVDPDALATAMDATVRAAGLSRRQRWSVLLPEAAVRPVVVTLETVPSTRDELREMVDWKVERMVGVPARELRISRQYVGAGHAPRFLVVAVRETVAVEYENLLRTLDWKAGLLVPRFVGEAAWLDWDPKPGDKLVVGSRGATCLASVVRSGHMLLVRSVNGDPERLHDEIYRVALFYRDRVAASPQSALVTSVLAYGGVDGERVSEAVADALGAKPALFEPVPNALDADGGAELDAAMLAAAGLATQAWAR